MKEFVVVSVLYGWYQYFMPLYAFSVLHSNPGAYVRFVVLDSSLLPLVSSLLSELRDAGYSNFEVLHKARLGLPGFSHDNYERFLLPRTYFDDFRYAWVGDIDFLIWPETPGWCEREAMVAELDGFCYSNVVRDGLLFDCMVGWHFFEVAPYFDKMSPVIADYIASPYPCVRAGIGLATADERLLYNLVKSGIGVREGSDRRLTCRDGHGIHLGTYRIGHRMPAWLLSEPWHGLIKSQLDHPLFRSFMRQITHPEMKKIFAGLRMDYGKPFKLLL